MKLLLSRCRSFCGRQCQTLFLCRGLEPQGFFHSKAAVVDRRYLYSGSPNFSFDDNSRRVSMTKEVLISSNGGFCNRNCGAEYKRRLAVGDQFSL